ncbi:unnamed protein product [Lymnaea stagnalis]|uniref:Uncharacterized protein n=1 Tax=Lymnaea stagnalis TaxID=6523 RepID=A0AAV2HYF5_LYMST
MKMNENLKKLRDVFLLLDPEDGSLLSAEDQEHQLDLKEIFEYYIQCSRRLSEYHQLHHTNQSRCNFSNIVPRFMQLLRECVLTHQWPQALKLALALSKEARGTETTLWKIGLTCLYQEGERSRRFVEQFVKQLYMLQNLAVVEVMLDFLLFLLTHSNLEDAKNLVQELKQKTLFPSQLINERRKMAHKLFFAYQGLTLYAEWKLALMKLDEEENDLDLISQKLSLGSSTRSTKAIADSAVEYLVTIKDTSGVWDIFITRLVEVYEYYGEVEEAQKILHAYRERNPTNPNAHRYLYELCSNNSEDEDVQLDCLKSIVQLDPCNSLCLKLYELTEANDSRAVSILFDYLDFDHCSGNEEVWASLANKLEQMQNDLELTEVVKSCWESRSDWWPVARFQGHHEVLKKCQAHINCVKQVMDKFGTEEKT